MGRGKACGIAVMSVPAPPLSLKGAVEARCRSQSVHTSHQRRAASLGEGSQRDHDQGALDMPLTQPLHWMWICIAFLPPLSPSSSPLPLYPLSFSSPRCSGHWPWSGVPEPYCGGEAPARSVRTTNPAHLLSPTLLHPH